MIVKYEQIHSKMSLLLFILFPLVNISEGRPSIHLPFMIEFIQDHVFYIILIKDVVIICLLSYSNSVINFVLNVMYFFLLMSLVF